MAHSQPARARTFALGIASVVVVTLLISLVAFVGRGGCTSAIALEQDRSERERAPLELVGATAGRVDEETRSGRDAQRGSAAFALGPIDGLVLDVTTHELVPFVELELQQGERIDRISVGADARFAAPADFPSGAVRAIVRDENVVVGEAVLEHDGLRGTHGWRIEVPIGPTIPVAAIDDRPVAADAWRARIVESALRPEVVGELEVVEGGLALRAPSAARADRSWSWRAFRSGNPAWIRYPHREHAPLERVFADLEVRDETANRQGMRSLRATVGIHDPVEVDTQPFGKARLRVRRDEGVKSPMRVVLYDTRDEPIEGSLTAPVFDEGEVGDDGYVGFGELAGGTKRVVGWSREDRLDAQILVTEGPSEFVELRAEPPPRESSGQPGPGFALVYSDAPVHMLAEFGAASGRMKRWGSTSSWSHERVEEGEGALGDGLDVSCVLGDFPDPRRAVYRPEDVFRFEAEDGVAARIAFGPVGALFPKTDWDAAMPLKWNRAPQFTWSAWAAGKQPVFGDRGVFRSSKDRQPSVTRLRFEAGWGAQIFLRAGDPYEIAKRNWPWRKARDRHTREKSTLELNAAAAVLAAPPVPGVTLRIDGLDAGLSDESGELRIAQPFPPVELTLIGRGWRVHALEKLPGSAPRYVAWLRRNP
jgi:hypothetical protein